MVRKRCLKAGMRAELVEWLVVVRAVRLLLKSNTFEYDSNLYTQATGVSIGGTFACTYSGVFMGEVKEEGLKRWYGRNDVGQGGSRVRGTG